ncbi:MAG: flagellar hook-associated protein FlgK [Verrucomicrobiota bacterium]|jgi:flagellar hook-associated protein 1 FlgK
MPGLFDSLNIASSGLNAQQQAVGVAGQNLANVNNPAYSRQVVVEQAATPLQTSLGQEGAGVQVVAIQQIRDAMLDGQIQGENSITSFLQTQQNALQNAQSNLGEQLQSAASSSDASSVGSTGGLDSGLSGLFNEFQALSIDPGSTPNRQAVISQAQQLAAQFNQVNQSLSDLHDQLNQSVQTGVGSANQLLSEIAGLNHQITLAQGASGGTANDLVDLRQEKLEDLAKLVNFQPVANSDGSVNVVVDGQLLVSGSEVQDTLQSYDAGGGQLMVRTAGAGTPLTLTGGSIQGAIDSRDNALASLQSGLNQLASQLITRVNAVYSKGCDLNGNTGASFFTGADASDIGVNAALASDPSALQAAGVAGASGDNQVAAALAQLGTAPQSGLGNQTFSGSYNATITDLGSALSTANSRLSDQQTVQNMLSQQRTSVSGVSLNDEMTHLMTYQQAFQAAAELVSTINTMLGDLMNAKQG